MEIVILFCRFKSLKLQYDAIKLKNEYDIKFKLEMIKEDF